MFHQYLPPGEIAAKGQPIKYIKKVVLVACNAEINNALFLEKKKAWWRTLWLPIHTNSLRSRLVSICTVRYTWHRTTWYIYLFSSRWPWPSYSEVKLYRFIGELALVLIAELQQFAARDRRQMCFCFFTIICKGVPPTRWVDNLIMDAGCFQLVYFEVIEGIDMMLMMIKTKVY